MPGNATLHDTDFHAWTYQQAALSRAARETGPDPLTFPPAHQAMNPDFWPD